MSGHGKNPNDRDPLTNWRSHKGGQVRTQKGSDRLRPTHRLETTYGGTSQVTERIRPTNVHSPTGDRTGMDKSGHRKNPTDRGSLTNWRPHREGKVRTWKESNQPRPTHQLEIAQGGTSQDTERIPSTEAHSPTRDDTGRDKSGHGKNPTDRGPLTNWRPHREEQVRTQKGSDRPRPTH